MTKAEACIQGWVSNPAHEIKGEPFIRQEDLDYTRTSQDGQEKQVRVYGTADGFSLHCDSYWGDSILWHKGRKIGNYEYRYEDLAGVIESVRSR